MLCRAALQTRQEQRSQRHYKTRPGQRPKTWPMIHSPGGGREEDPSAAANFTSNPVPGGCVGGGKAGRFRGTVKPQVAEVINFLELLLFFQLNIMISKAAELISCSHWLLLLPDTRKTMPPGTEDCSPFPQVGRGGGGGGESDQPKSELLRGQLQRSGRRSTTWNQPLPSMSPRSGRRRRGQTSCGQAPTPRPPPQRLSVRAPTHTPRARTQTVLCATSHW